MKLLLDNGADVNAGDVNAGDQSQYTPLHLAQNEAIVKLLLDQGVDVNAVNIGLVTSLHCAQNCCFGQTSRQQRRACRIRRGRA